MATPPTNNNDDGRLDESIAEELVARGRSEASNLSAREGCWVISPSKSSRPGLGVEMDEHLGYSRHDSAGRNGDDSRNGTRSKTVITEIGPAEIEVPRDIDSSFEPATVKKRSDG